MAGLDESKDEAGLCYISHLYFIHTNNITNNSTESFCCFFTIHRYASAAYAVMCVCLSVCQSHTVLHQSG